MKKIMSVAICMLLLMAMIVPVSAEGSFHVSISAGSSYAYPGETVDFYISVSGSGTCASLGCFLDYDSSVLEFVGGSVYAGGIMAGSMDSDGLVISYNGEGDPTGTIAGFTMRVRDGASMGETYISADPYSQGASISASGAGITIACSHSYGDWQQYDETYHQKSCSICGETTEEEHGWNEGAVASAPTCKDEGSMTYTCITCGEIKTETLDKTEDHEYGAYQKVDESQHASTCSICGKSLTAAHTWDIGTVTKKETCKETGITKYTCTDCGATKEETIPVSTQHTFGDWKKVDDKKHARTCSVCGKSSTAEHTWDAGTVTKKETCKETGITKFTCTDCGATREETIPVSTRHTFSAWQKVDDNQHARSCSVCAKKETANHNWDDGSVTKKPNCEEKGSCVYSCLDCGHAKTEELPVSDDHTYDHGCDKDCNVCGKTRSTSHSYGSSWSKDSESHWRECTECGETSDKADHVPGDEATEESAQYCTVCDYMLKPALTHEHQFEEAYKTDKTGHWYPCTGCEERKDYAKHAFANACDGLCEVCNYTRPVKHTIGEKWFMDAKGHFQKCETCGQEEKHLLHSAGPEATETTPQTCEVCGFELAPARGHSFSKEWLSDELNHFHACACGEKIDTAQHQWDEGVRERNGKVYTCTVCQYQRFESSNLTLLIVSAGVAVAAAAGGAVIFVFKRKKK